MGKYNVTEIHRSFVWMDGNRRGGDNGTGKDTREGERRANKNRRGDEGEDKNERERGDEDKGEESRRNEKI